MKKISSSLTRFMIGTAFLTVLLFPSSDASSAAPQEQWVAKAVSIHGTVESQRVGEPQWLKISEAPASTAGKYEESCGVRSCKHALR